MTTNAVLHPTAATQECFTTRTVTSKDGTAIGYRQFGQGPAIVVLHGAASSGYNHRQLAEALADTFTVIVPDRRGRGLSGPYGADHTIDQDVEDLDAILTATGAHNLFGISSGAIICLQAALSLPAIRKVAIFEPPLFPRDSTIPTTILRRFDEELAEGNLAAAMITGMKGAQMGPPIFNFIPRWLLERLVGMAMKSEDRKGSGAYVPMRAIAPTLHYDFQIAAEMSGKQATFKDITADLLLLGGSKSPDYLKAALVALEQIVPHARRIELPGLDHAASWNVDRGGKPQPVAEALRRFFVQQ